MEEPACKPDPVHRSRGRRPSLSGAPRRSRRPVLRAGAAYPTASDGPPSCLLDLAPGGACRAASVTRRAGGLLPHRFTLTSAASHGGGLFSVALPRGHPRPALTGTLPFGVRTFLERERPRPPGRLLHARAYRRGRGAPRGRRPPPRCGVPRTPPSAAAGEPVVDALVRQAVGLLVPLSRHVLEADRREPPRSGEHLAVQRHEMRGLHAVLAGELVDQQL